MPDQTPAQTSAETPALSTLTTMQVGGVPERLLEPLTRDDLIAAALDVWAYIVGEHRKTRWQRDF